MRLGATEISNSWGGPEPEHDSPAFNHPKTVITAAAGDDGYLNWTAAEAGGPSYFIGADYPASSPHVVAVGGTELTLTEAGAAAERDGMERGPRSRRRQRGRRGRRLQRAVPRSRHGSARCPTGRRSVAAPAAESKRAVADVAADADPYSGVPVYDSHGIHERPAA